MKLDTLLSPIRPEAPCGDDLSFSPEFDRIAELRRADDPSLNQGEWLRELKSADFPTVRALCSELLTTRTKDLRLAAWMADAQARTEGFEGLASGLEGCAALCEHFWEDLHPAPEDGDFEQRMGNLSWLLQQVAEAAQTIPLLQGAAMRHGRRVIESARARKGAESTNGLTEEGVTQALAQTPAAHLLAVPAAVDASLIALTRLQTAVDTRQPDGPAFAPAREALQDTLHLARRLIRERGLSAPGEESATAQAIVDTVRTGASSTDQPITNGPLQTRAQALAQLRAVADFFRRTEPHSPVAYLADKAAHWGDLPLHLWLRAVLKDQATMTQLDELLGVAPPPQP